MSNTSVFSQVNAYYSDARAYVEKEYSSYEAVRRGIETYAQKKLSTKNAELISRITSCVSEVLIDFCALTGVFVFPAVLLYGIKRCIPLSKYALEYVKKGSTQESRRAKWEEIKKEYAESFHNTMGPALLVAMSVNALFWLTYGLVTLNAALLFKTVAISLPACYLVYKALLGQPEVPILVPQPQMPATGPQEAFLMQPASQVVAPAESKTPPTDPETPAETK